MSRVHVLPYGPSALLDKVISFPGYGKYSVLSNSEYILLAVDEKHRVYGRAKHPPPI